MSKESNVSSRKLSSYSAAAALGAFVVPIGANAEVVYTQLDPDVETFFADPPNTPLVNIDNSTEVDDDGNPAPQHELAFITTSSNRNIQIRPTYTGTTLTSAGTYYARGFTEGVLIGPGANSTGGADVAATGGGYNFFNGDNLYVGVSFEIAGQLHYGYVGFQVVSTAPLRGIIRDYAYESTPGVGIVAGAVPEPGSLGLLAAGAGAFAFRRKRDCA